MANYVKFRRGTIDQFLNLPHKDEDTLYFITSPDSTEGTLYLGSKLIAGGSSSEGNNTPVLDVLLKDLSDKDFLMYDALQGKWINTTIDELLGTFEGATEEGAGLAGLVPAPNKGDTDSFLRSDGTWAEISASQNITTIENLLNKTHAAIMDEVDAANTPVVDDILIIKDVIAEGTYSYTSYVHDGTNWTAMDGNYNAENVYFKNDFIFTEPVGTVEIPESGSTTVAAAGKNIKEFLSSLFAQEENPMVSQPTIDIILNNATTSYEVGSSYTPGYSIIVDGGKYSFGPETGVEPLSCSITDTIDEHGTSHDWAKIFDPIIITDTTEYKVSGTVTYSDGVIPVTNLGNPYPEGQIKSKTVNIQSPNKIKGYRKTFYGTFNIKEEELNSSDIRSLKSSSSGLSNGSTFNVSIPIGAVRVVIAYPDNLRDLTSVKDENAWGTDVVDSFVKYSVNVEGFNGYTAKPYKVFIFDYGKAATAANTYKVTI